MLQPVADIKNNKRNYREYILEDGMRCMILSVMLLLGLGYASTTSALECLPTCSTMDGRFLNISGPGLSTIVDEEIVVNLVSKTENLEFSVFDGDGGGFWDNVNGDARLNLLFQLYADPQGDASGLSGSVLATWTGDGSGGLNNGTPMNDNDWSDFTLRNVVSAQAANGDFVYTLRVSSTLPMSVANTANNFKIRTEEMAYVPAMLPVTFIVPISAELPDQTLEQILLLYPNASCDNPECTSICGLPEGETCNPLDPDCCLFESTYDGSWSFFMVVPEGQVELDVWDGDLDFGDFSGNAVDTDDPNTPGDPFLPPWSIGTDVVFQTARPANPPDNVTPANEGIFVRDPNIQYLVIDPLGNSYQNFNPSGDREWELFRLSTTTDNPAVAEYQVDSILPGMWEVRLIGTDIANLNSILLPFDLRGEIVEGPPPAQVPTLNEWGLIALAFMGLLVSVIYLRNRKMIMSNNDR